MPDTEKPLFKLTPQAKGSFYYLYKWANEDINVYGEVMAWSRRATVYVREIYSESVSSSFTLKVDENKPFEILWENVEDITNDEPHHIDACANQRRTGGDYPNVDEDTIQECEQLLREYGNDEPTLVGEQEGWQLVGSRVGISHGDVEVEKVPRSAAHLL